ncbi:YitT family protein [Lacinutrix jangbogonensis]|uniref:YitT family protein n=1 Tax=Lacinutrix jangbogonensis TaxID=1469557 RepID=UPI00053EAAFA|nr:YitT family protein [Lacinutrix jangbogonensis]
MNKAKIIDIIKEYSQILLAILLASIGLKAFLLPNNFLDGGATGIAILISKTSTIDISIILLLVSIPFLIIGAYTVSRRILIKSIISIILLSISISLETFPTITEDKLLISFFGGLFLGSGIGLAIRNGSVLDGSEILGIFIYDRFGISIGKTILFFNIILFCITAMVLTTEIAMYSILTYVITAKVIDLIIEGFEDFVGFTIVSRKAEAIENALLYDMGVGVTIYKGASGYGSSGIQEETRLIHTVINRIDIRKTYRLINAIDEDAFIIEFDINNVKGGVLRRYFNTKEGKNLDLSKA